MRPIQDSVAVLCCGPSAIQLGLSDTPRGNCHGKFNGTGIERSGSERREL